MRSVLPFLCIALFTLVLGASGLLEEGGLGVCKAGPFLPLCHKGRKDLSAVVGDRFTA